ncbi:MAG: hypothetical protein J6E46_13745 [Faecalicoccus sp.]|nr:hypothetical protein [Faecalicoccus sp.]
MKNKKVLSIGLSLMMAFGMTGCGSGGNGGQSQQAAQAYTVDDVQGIWRNDENGYRAYIEGEKMYYTTSYTSSSNWQQTGDLDRLDESIIEMNDKEYKIEKDDNDNLILVNEEDVYKHIKQQKQDMVTHDTVAELAFCKFGIDSPYASDLIDNWLYNTAGEGNTYIIAVLGFESSYEKELDMSNVAGKVIIDDKYEYQAKIWSQTKGDLKVSPLEMGVAFFTAEVPEKAINSGQTVRIEVAFNENLCPKAWDAEDLKDGLAQYDYLFVTEDFYFESIE